MEGPTRLSDWSWIRPVQKLSLYSIITLLAIAAGGTILMAVYNPFNNQGHALSPRLNLGGSNISQSSSTISTITTSVATTSTTTISSTTTNSTSSNRTSTSSSVNASTSGLLSNPPPNSGGGGGDDGGSWGNSTVQTQTTTHRDT